MVYAYNISSKLQQVYGINYNYSLSIFPYVSPVDLTRIEQCMKFFQIINLTNEANTSVEYSI